MKTLFNRCFNGHVFDALTTYIRADGRRECRICRDLATARSRAKSIKARTAGAAPAPLASTPAVERPFASPAVRASSSAPALGQGSGAVPPGKGVGADSLSRRLA